MRRPLFNVNGMMEEFMIDPRMRKLARQVMEYSVSLKPGEKVLIDIWDKAEDMAVALVEAAHELGAYPFVNLQSMMVNRSLMMHCCEESMEAWYDYEVNRMKAMDAYVVVRKQDNIYEYADVPEQNRMIYNRYYGLLHNGERIQHTKWCVLRYPNASMAQLSGMSTEEFEDFYFKTCCIDYRKLNEIAGALNRLAAKTDKVRIVAPDTDLTFSVKGMCQLESLCGIFNLPCGETGMMVVPGTANGTIHYNIPSAYQGHVFTDIRFTLKDGVIVEASSSDTPAMNRILDTDENARKIGEFSIGFNPLITKPILDTLFDEKMAMSLHFTPGNSGNNPSAIHWDIVQSHSPETGGGEIWFDDVLIRKDGVFVVEELLALNPENMIRHIAAKE